MGYEYGAHSVVIHTIDSGSAVKLGGISSMGMPLGIEVSQDDSGAMFDSFASINMMAPKPQYGTRSIAAALGVIPINGICINADLSHPGVSLFGEAKGDCQAGDPAADDHLEYLVDLGLITPMQLTGSRKESMRLSVELDAITDGVNAPFGADYEAVLPTGLNIDEYGLGAMKFANILWEDGRNFDLAFNVERIEDEPQLGGVWKDRAGRRKARPKLTVTGRNPRKLDDSTGIPLNGKSGVHGDTIVYFKKKKNRGTYYDDSDPVHLKMTMSGLFYFDNPFSASGAASAETTLMGNGLHDGTNSPIIFTPNVVYDPTP